MSSKTKKLVGMGLLTALVIVLQVVAVMIRPMMTFSISLVLVPIVVGAALYGYKAGAWLGLVFSIVVLINDSAPFLAFHVPGTVLTVIAKGTLAGLVAGLVYLWIEKKNRYVAVIAAAIVSPLVNTGIFVLGCKVFFMPLLEQWAVETPYENAVAYLFLGMIGVNFLIEFAINLVLSPTVMRIINFGKKNA